MDTYSCFSFLASKRSVFGSCHFGFVSIMQRWVVRGDAAVAVRAQRDEDARADGEVATAAATARAERLRLATAIAGLKLAWLVPPLARGGRVAAGEPRSTRRPPSVWKSTTGPRM